jgi:hypothetical protein
MVCYNKTAPLRPTAFRRTMGESLYTAAHKALCSLAFALQEVSMKQHEKENDHAPGESGQAQEEAAQQG